MIRVAVVALLAALACAAQAGAELPVEKILKGAVEKSANAMDAQAAKPVTACESLVDPVRNDCQEALRARYRYESIRLTHRSAVFAWQLFSSRLIFGLVTALVFSGIGLTIWQFRYVFSRRRAKGVELTSELEISLEKIRVNSAVVGVVVLSLSLAFYFLYLMYVFPVEVIR